MSGLAVLCDGQSDTSYRVGRIVGSERDECSQERKDVILKRCDHIPGSTLECQVC
jgi:hypothetical protein